MSISPLAELLSCKRLLIFDLDGTLVDSSPIHARAFDEVLAPEGIPVDYRSIAGMTTVAAVSQLAAAAGRKLDADTRERLVRAKRDRAFQLVDAELTAIDGAVEFVHAARQRFSVALCTSGSRRTVDAALSRIGLSACFDPVVTSEDLSHGKPDPEAFLKALDAHDLGAREALVFEDSESGLEAAERAGMDCVRISTADGEPGISWPALNAALTELQ